MSQGSQDGGLPFFLRYLFFWLGKNRSTMKKLLLLTFLSAMAFTVFCNLSYAQTCDSNHYDMLDWMTLDTATTQHLTGTSNPLYSILPANSDFWWIKGSSGYPWDVQYYDSTYIYQWVTELTWGDP